MLLAAGGAPGQVGAHPGDQRVGVAPGQLSLDVAVELVEARVAAELRDTRAEERRKWRAIHVSVNQHMKRKYGSDR